MGGLSELAAPVGGVVITDEYFCVQNGSCFPVINLMKSL